MTPDICYYYGLLDSTESLEFSVGIFIFHIVQELILFITGFSYKSSQHISIFCWVKAQNPLTVMGRLWFVFLFTW